MTKITSDDFGDSPKKQFIKNYNTAFAESDIERIVSMMSDDAEWELVGAETIQGKDAIRASLESMGLEQATELKIDNIVEDGDKAAANGVMYFDGSTVAFCDVYAFDGEGPDAKIKRLTSYGVELK